MSHFHDSSKPIIILVYLAGLYWLSFKNRKYVLQRLLNTSEKFMYVPGGVAGNVATDPVVMDAIAHSKAIWDHRGKATQTDSRASECAGGQDVVVYGYISWILVQTRHRHSFRIYQVT